MKPTKAKTPNQIAEALLRVKQSRLNPELHGHDKNGPYRTGLKWHDLKRLARAFIVQRATLTLAPVPTRRPK